MEKPIDRSLIVIDIGGTNIRINHVDCITKTPDNKTEIFPSSSLVPAAPIDALINLINTYIAKQRIIPEAIVIGLPASFDANMDEVIRCTNLPFLQHCKLATALRTRFHVPVFLEHDTLLLLLGESTELDIRKSFSTLGVFFGTGIGADILLGNKPFRLPHGSFELGHIPLHHHGKRCICGKYGCIEAYSNGHLFFELAQNNTIPIKKIFQSWNSKDKIGRTLKTMVDIQALAVSTAAMLFMPSHIIIGGGIVAMQGYPKHYLEEQIKYNTLFPDLKPYFSIKWANLGEAAFLYGGIKIWENVVQH